MPEHVHPDVHTDQQEFGLACWSGVMEPMRRAHRHDDIEVNLVVEGRLDYLFGSRRVSIPSGVASLFWAALPHQVVATEPGTRACWLTVPLPTVLRWRLAADWVTALLSGAPLLTPPLPGPDPLDSSATFVRWAADLAGGDPGLTPIVLLETEALMRRILRVARRDDEPVAADQPALTRSRGAAMARFVATHFREPLTVADVAGVVHLNTHYAMQVFRQAVGSTIGHYLTQCRLAEAQRLLITSQLTVSAIAHEAGFGSTSRLYAASAEAGLPAPAAYRRIQQDAAGWTRPAGPPAAGIRP